MSEREARIALLTDFGVGSLYTGQMQMALKECCATISLTIVDLVSDLPKFRPDLAAYLLPALTAHFSKQWLSLCVVDPGVGSSRRALALKADDQWFVGPDNGLLAQVADRASKCQWWTLPLPNTSSATFHGRDLFAPEAAHILIHGEPTGEPIADVDIVGSDWPSELPKIIYIDHYGNLMTGVRANSISLTREFCIGGYLLNNATTFSDLPEGVPFWYKNSIGLVEFAVNKSRADRLLGLALGETFE